MMWTKQFIIAEKKAEGERGEGGKEGARMERGR